MSKISDNTEEQGSLFIEGDRVELRTVEESDLEFLNRYVNHPEIRRNIDVFREPTNMEGTRQFFEEIVQAENSVNFVAWDGEERMGSIMLMPVKKDNGWADVGAWVKPEHQGEGYGTEATRLATDYGFDQLRLHRIQARTLKRNEASRRTLEKLGFESDGVHRDAVFLDGEYLDHCYYSVLEDEWE